MKKTAALCEVVLLLCCGCRTTAAPHENAALSTPADSAVAPPALSQQNPARDSRENSAATVPLPSAVQRAGYQADGVHKENLPLTPREPTVAVTVSVEPIEPLPRSELTLASAEQIALDNNPVLVEAEARVEAARGEWLQVGLPPNLRLGYTGSEIGNDGAGGQQGGLVAQEFITGGKLRLNRNRAAWRIRRWEQELESKRLRVLTDVRVGFFDLLIAQRRRELAAELVHVSERGVEAAQALFRGAEVSEADPLRARIDADNARIVLQNAVNQHFEAWRRLAALMGMPEMQLQHVDGPISPDGFNVAPWDQELRRVLTESPEIAAAIADVESAQWAVERAYAEVIPDFDVQSSVQKDDASDYTIAGLQIELPLPLINRNQGGIRSAQADAVAAVRAVDRVALDLQTRLATAYQRYQSARNQVEQYSISGGILDKSQRTLDLIRAGYQAEEFGVLDLLTAQRTYFQTNLAYLDSLRDMAASATEIRGLLLTNSLSSELRP
jgi:cobalt-zinc-cadmium efflux system outer membrane protein